MKYLTTLFCIICTLNSFAQTPLIHLESHNLKKKSTTYFGTLADFNANERLNTNNFINFNPSLKLNGYNDYFKIEQEIPDLKQLTIFTVFMPAENSAETFDIWQIQAENSSYVMTKKLANNTASELPYQGINNGKPVIHCYTQYYNAPQSD